MSQAANPTPEQVNVLLDLGVKFDQIPEFVGGRPVVYGLPTESEPGVAIVQMVGSRLRSGIVTIKDPGGGLKTFVRFRGRSVRVAAQFGLTELELFGAAITNDELREILLRQGYQSRTEQCPDELGGGTVEILTRVHPVRR